MLIRDLNDDVTWLYLNDGVRRTDYLFKTWRPLTRIVLQFWGLRCFNFDDITNVFLSGEI